MASVAQAVWEFDEAVQAPWRPPLRAVPGNGRAHLRPVPSSGARPRSTIPGAGRSAAPGGPHGGRSPSGRPLGAREAGPARLGPPVPGPRDVPGLRLTRRARRVVSVLVLGAVLALGSWLGSVLSGPGGDGLQLVRETSVVVESGDTLWSIAGSVAGEDDVRVVVDRIQELNGLSSADLVPGQVLRLP